ncbi:hypothetical protein AMTRI_Chr05g72360 [Amborella trichopoda]
MAVEFSLLGRANPKFTLQFRPASDDFMVRKSVRSFQGKNPVVFKQNDSDKEKGNISCCFPNIKEMVSGDNLMVRSEFLLRKHTALTLRWGEVEFVRGMCFVMRSEVKDLKRENGVMREWSFERENGVLEREQSFERDTDERER